MAKMILKNVEMNWPFIFTRSVYRGRPGKYSAWLVVSPDQDQIIGALTREVEKAKKIKDINPSPEFCCLKSGELINEKFYDPGTYILRCTSTNQPIVKDAQNENIYDRDEIELIGAKVNAVVELWPHIHTTGEERVCATIFGIQVLQEGEGFTPNENLEDEVSHFFSKIKQEEEDVPF